MNDTVVRSTLNDFIGASGATFEQFAAKLYSMTYKARKQTMAKLSDAVFGYLQSTIENGLAAEAENVQFLITELTDFAEVHEDKCKVALKKAA